MPTPLNKVSTADLDLNEVVRFLKSAVLSNAGIFLNDMDITMDFAGSFDRDEVCRYLITEEGFRLQGDVEQHESEWWTRKDIKYVRSGIATILENAHFVGNNCLTYMTRTRCGLKKRCKIYDKMVQMLESKSVRGTVGAHWRGWAIQKGTRLAKARDEATKEGLTRMEITFYMDGKKRKMMSRLKICEELEMMREFFPSKLVYATPYFAKWKAFCECFNSSLVVYNTSTDVATFVYAHNEVTGKTACVQVKNILGKGMRTGLWEI